MRTVLFWASVLFVLIGMSAIMTSDGWPQRIAGAVACFAGGIGLLAEDS